MTAIEFETPTLDEKGRVIAQTHHTASQLTDDLGNGISLDMVLYHSSIFEMGSLPHQGASRAVCPQWFDQ